MKTLPVLSAARHSREMVKIKGLSDTLGSKWEKTENYGFIILTVKISIFWFPLLPFSRRRRPGEGKRKSCSRRPWVHTEICFYSTENLCALLPFAFICTYTSPPLPPPPRPPVQSKLIRPPTKGSVTFLNEEINLSWHPPPFFAFMVISFRKGGETICDSIRRGFLCLNLIYKSHIFVSERHCCCWVIVRNWNWNSYETSDSQHILCLLKNCLSMFLINPQNISQHSPPFVVFITFISFISNFHFCETSSTKK